MRKILVVGMSNNIGGTETFFHNYYRHFDLDKYHFDFIAAWGTVAFADEYEKNGSKIYSLPNFMKNPIGYYRKMRKIIRDEKYDVVHINMLSAANILPVKAALKEKVPKVVVHSHNSNMPKGILRKCLHIINRPILRKENLVRLSCGQLAGEWLFGRKTDFTIINNAIKFEDFKFDDASRLEIRKRYKIKDTDILLGNIGRLSEQKNQKFLLEILAKLDEKYKLMIVGDGDKKKDLIDMADKSQLSGRVIFVPNTLDVKKYYSAFDLFVFPSKFEGLPLAPIEAQANGLKCIVSDNVSEATNVVDLERIPLVVDNWVSEIESFNLAECRNITLVKDKMKKSGFCIDYSARDLIDVYDENILRNDHNKIDFVIMWVDPNDSKWQAEKNKYVPEKNTDSSERRYRDWDNLKYWFRGVEQYAPWVNKIYFVTYGHVPKWLNVYHPKLEIVNHSDFIPAKYLPTFSANPIELNLHRINGLSENFVFFNDDFFLMNPTKPEDFFKNGLPCDSACMYINIPSGDVADSLFDNDMIVINRNFSFKKSLRQNFFKWFNIKNGKYLYNNFVLSVYKKFVGIHFSHLPASFSKSTFVEIWSKEPDILNNTCLNRFRSTDDVNQWLVKYWQICKGNFVPRRVKWGKYYEYSMGNSELNKIFESSKYKAICLNDTVTNAEFERAKKLTNDLFEKKFNMKSGYER